jgi:hypothetical protein
MNGPIPFTDRQLFTMATLYARGEGVKTIAEKYGVAHTVIRQRLMTLGIRLRLRGAPRVKDMDLDVLAKAHALRKEDYSWRWIARQLGQPDHLRLAQAVGRAARNGLLGAHNKYHNGRPGIAYFDLMLNCAKAMHEDGLTWPVIAQAFGASPTALNHAVSTMEQVPYESCA